MPAGRKHAGHAQQRNEQDDGRALRHHVDECERDEPGGKAALNPSDSAVPAPDNGSSYQSGGTQQDRAQKDAERKADENTSGSPTDSSGAADPAPGSQGGQNP